MNLYFEQSLERDDRILIYMNGEFWKEIDKTLHQKILNEIKNFSKENYLDAERLIVKNFLYKQLAKKNFYSKEIEDWLIKLGVSEEIIQNLLLEFQNLGYLNDEEYLKNFIEYSMKNKRGTFWIKNKLFQKKIPQNEIDHALSLYVDKDALKEQIQKIIESKSKEINLRERKGLFKITQFLLRKGYSMDVISEVLCMDDFL